MVREITLVSLNVSLMGSSVREMALGNLAVNSIHLSKFLSKEGAHLTKVREMSAFFRETECQFSSVRYHLPKMADKGLIEVMGSSTSRNRRYRKR